VQDDNEIGQFVPNKNSGSLRGSLDAAMASLMSELENMLLLKKQQKTSLKDFRNGKDVYTQ